MSKSTDRDLQIGEIREALNQARILLRENGCLATSQMCDMAMQKLAAITEAKQENEDTARLRECERLLSAAATHLIAPEIRQEVGAFLAARGVQPAAKESTRKEGDATCPERNMTFPGSEAARSVPSTSPAAKEEPRYRVNAGDEVIGIGEAAKEKLMDAVFAEQEGAPAAELEIKLCPFCGRQPESREFSMFIGVRCSKCSSAWMLLGTWQSRAPSPAPSKPVAASGEERKQTFEHLLRNKHGIDRQVAAHIGCDFHAILLAALASASSPGAAT